MKTAMPKKIREQKSWPVVLKDWRARRGITQKEAAGKIGVAVRTYQAWEGGEQNPIFPSPEVAEEIFKP